MLTPLPAILLFAPCSPAMAASPAAAALQVPSVAGIHLPAAVSSAAVAALYASSHWPISSLGTSVLGYSPFLVSMLREVAACPEVPSA
jgi:hypothetical protein